MPLQQLTKLPDFPENPLGLKRGTVLRVAHPVITDQLGLKMNRLIPIGYDGECVRCGPFTWSIAQICQEITDRKWWEIDGHMDLSDPTTMKEFNVLFEQIEIVTLN